MGNPCFMCVGTYTDDPTKKIQEGIRKIRLNIFNKGEKDGYVCKEHNSYIPKDQTIVDVDFIQKIQ